MQHVTLVPLPRYTQAASGYDAAALRPCMALLSKLHGCAWFAASVDALKPCLPVGSNTVRTRLDFEHFERLI